jgi:membrane protease YdiL (CAAX protease family)
MKMLPSLDARAGAREALLAAAALLAMLTVSKHLARAIGFGEIWFTAVAAFQLYAPIWLAQRRGEAPEVYALHAHGMILGPLAALRARLVRARRARRSRGRASRISRILASYARGARLNGQALQADLGRALLTMLVTFPPFLLAHHGYQLWRGASGYHFAVPPDLLDIFLKNTFLVALPEEMFYRGFLEHRLDRLWPTVRWFVVPLSRTVVLASALFALGHFLGEYNPARLGPFFPAFVFSMLVRRGGSMAGAVFYHGASNAFSALLFAGYAGSR